MNRKGLGKGLGALIASENEENGGVLEVKINEIEPNVNQPRKNFDDEKLQQLAESIQQHGVVQPIIVKKEEEIYRIVAGERRWRAARLAGLKTVPVVVKEFSNRQLMEIALIENIQREDLNPIEEAEAFEKLLKEFDMSQEELAKTVGKSRPAISNSLRLLGLDSKIQSFIISGDLSSGHARALMAIDNGSLRLKAAHEVMLQKLSVRETEKLVKRFLQAKTQKTMPARNEQVQQIEEKLQHALGTKVKLIANNKKGKILIEYYSNDELERIMEIFTNSSSK